MAVEFNPGLVAGSLSSLRAFPVLRRFGSTFGSSGGGYANSKGYVNSRSMEMGNMSQSNASRKKRRRHNRPMGESVLEQTVNVSEERILGDDEHGKNGP